MEPLNERQSGETLSAALTGAADMLGTDATGAATRASEILDAVPGQQQALLLLVSGLRLLGKGAAAREVLEWMAEQHPNLAAVHYELGLLLGRLGLRKEATERLLRVVELEPNHPAAWRALGNQRALGGDTVAAGEAYAEHAKRSLKELKLLEDALAAGNDELIKTENMLRQSLDINPTDVSMLRMLATVYVRLSRSYEARIRLVRALELAPEFQAAREDYAAALSIGMQWREANEQYDILMGVDPRRGFFESLKATNLVMLGDYEQAFALFDMAKPHRSNDPSFWINYGHTLRTVGRGDEAIDAYRKCLELDPGFGAAWYAFANLKTYRFSAAEIERMRVQLQRDDRNDGQRAQLGFALGHALEDQKAYAESFEHYREANAVLRRYVHHDAAENTKLVGRAKSFFTPDFFQERAGQGCLAADPIFIVGMVRAGSTLIEQILSSHSLVEGTMELPDLVDIVTELGTRHGRAHYPGILSKLDGPAMKALGEQYLEMTRSQRKLGRPYFTDKAGGNFIHIGLIQLILPNAKIVDARRHPLGNGFSAFKQVFPATSVAHAYDLSELGQYYRDYVELMAHFDKVLPGRVHRVFYEDVVRNTENEIRRLLDYCGLPFEEKCLRFYETDRGVRTSSSEQVRKPISTKGVETWQHYEPWLGPVKEALGDVLDLYPAVPEFE
ncbi:MAG TPA: sulfotransferase [Rhizomicrobium sp.]